MEVIEPPATPPAILREYQASDDPVERADLYECRESLRPYWDRESWLSLGFERGEPCVRASHYVGIFPFRSEGRERLLLVTPKGCEFDTPDRPVGLLRFLEMIALADGGEAGEEQEGLGMEGPGDDLLTLLAAHYGKLLHDLCRQDFRRYFRPEEGELRGRVRGRIHVPGHLRNHLHGRAHLLPCRWEEFTPDNWDNRILLRAMKLVRRAAASLAPRAAEFVRERFAGLDPWFSAVEDVPVRLADLGKARLWRTSRHYRRALAWARLIFRGLHHPAAGGHAPPLVLDANVAFERFAEVVVGGAPGAAGRDDWDAPSYQESFACLSGPQDQVRIPDLTLRDGKRVLAVGDAKYKLVLDLKREQLRDFAGAVVPKLSSADWNQLYVCMRIAGASHGFFVVPFWDADEGAEAARLLDGFRFAVPPLDATDPRAVRVAVLGLNLLRPLTRVREAGAGHLARWLRGSSTP